MAAPSQCRRLSKKGRYYYTLRNPFFEKGKRRLDVVYQNRRLAMLLSFERIKSSAK